MKLGTEGPVKTLPTPRKVQLLFGGVYILRTTKAVYVWEHPFYPQFYVPLSELVAASESGSFELEEVEKFRAEDGKHVATQYVIRVPKTIATNQIVAFSDELHGNAEQLKGLVKIEFGVCQWFEEDTPIHVHPKDPFKRVDVLQSTRDIKVSVDGQMIAHTTTSMHLYETGLPCRFYIPLTSIDPTVLRPSDMRTKCPYKGEAEYYNVEVNGKLHENLFWYYTRPNVEVSKVEGLVCPYNERVDIELDGQKLERPETHFGRMKVGQKPSII